MNYIDFVTSRIKWLENPTLDIVHAAMGLLGEAVEHWEAQDASHQKEELSDIEFYLEHAIQALVKAERPIQDALSREAFKLLHSDPCGSILHWCAEFHDRAKKLFIYNKQDVNFAECVTAIKLCLHILAVEHNCLREDLQAQNQAKLEKRFPTGYSDAAAQARADKQGVQDDRA
jgi:hypothetical protein